MTNITKLLRLGLCLCAVACGNPSEKASDTEFIDSVAEALADGGQINLDQLQWTREPAACEIKDGVISITPLRTRTSGSGRIIISGTTMLRCCRCRLKRSFSAL